MKKRIDKDSHLFTDNENGILRIDIEGEKQDIWNALRASLLQFIKDWGQVIIDKKRQSTLSDELQDYLVEASQAGKSFLRKFSLQNAHIEAETIVKLREAELIDAETRKTNAEARKLEIDAEREDFNWALEKMEIMVNLGMIFIESKDDNDEILLFLKAAQNQLRIIKGRVGNF